MRPASGPCSRKWSASPAPGWTERRSCRPAVHVPWAPGTVAGRRSGLVGGVVDVVAVTLAAAARTPAVIRVGRGAGGRAMVVTVAMRRAMPSTLVAAARPALVPLHLVLAALLLHVTGPAGSPGWSCSA